LKKFKNGDFSLIEAIPFHDTFGSPDRANFTKFFIETLYGKKQNFEKFDVYREKILKKICFDSKEFKVDVIVNSTDVYWDLEAYTIFGRDGLTKSLAYEARIFQNQFEIGDEYKNVKKVIQIIIVEQPSIPLKEELIAKYTYKNKNFELSQLEEIILVRLDLLERYLYNDDGKCDIKLLKFLQFLKAKNQKERDTIVGRKKGMLKEINSFIKRFMKSERAHRRYKKYGLQERVWREQGLYLGRKEGRKEGQKQGRILEKYNIITNMYQNGCDLQFISKTVEIPVVEIKKILEKQEII